MFVKSLPILRVTGLVEKARYLSDLRADHWETYPYRMVVPHRMVVAALGRIERQRSEGHFLLDTIKGHLETYVESEQ